MTTFVQLHLLTSYPPGNLNRDDLGRPKTAKMGGFNRLRISSQSLKRAWRISPLFEEALGGHVGKRTKQLGVRVYQTMKEKGVEEKLAEKCAQNIAEVFGKLKSNKDKDKPLQHLEIEQLVHVSPIEQQKIDQLTELLIQEKREPTAVELELLTKERLAVDIAMFGRMLADKPEYNVQASIQVAHAISVHSVAIEDDYFTAVDDLNDKNVSTGSAHIGESGFAAALFYLYICIDRDLLLHHLQGDQTLADKVLAAFIETAVKVPPKGKQNSFATRAYASYALAEIGSQQPRSLSVAFLKPINGLDYPEEAVEALKNQKDAIERVFGHCSQASYEFNAFQGKGTLSELLKFICLTEKTECLTT